MNACPPHLKSSSRCSCTFCQQGVRVTSVFKDRGRHFINGLNWHWVADFLLYSAFTSPSEFKSRFHSVLIRAISRNFRSSRKYLGPSSVVIWISGLQKSLNSFYLGVYFRGTCVISGAGTLGPFLGARDPLSQRDDSQQHRPLLLTSAKEEQSRERLWLAPFIFAKIFMQI